MIKLYGIKNCDTVRRTRKWLDSRNIDYAFHDFREDGLNESLLNRLEMELGWSNMINRRSTSWRQLSASQRENLDTEKAKLLMLEQPTLIKRPVLESGKNILIGFSPDQYQQIL